MQQLVQNSEDLSEAAAEKNETRLPGYATDVQRMRSANSVI